MATSVPGARGWRRAVVGYDGSECAERAIERTAALACAGASVLVVNAAALVYRSPAAAPMLEPGEAEETRRLLDEARELFARRGIAAHTAEAEGDAAHALADAAAEAGADVIVVGTRGRSRAAGLLLGSVSAKVVRIAPCDVVVVR